MIELNLLPEELRKKEMSGLSLADLPVKKALTIFLAAFFGIQILASIFAAIIKIDLASTKGAVASLTATSREIAAHKAETAQLQNRLKEVRTVTTRPFYWSSLLNGVSDSMIKGVWLNGFSITDMAQAPRAAKRPAKAPAPAKSSAASAAAAPKGAPANLVRALKLEGSVVSRGDETAYIGKFIKELKSNARLSQLFTDIDLSDINQKKIKDIDVYDFVLMCVFKNDKLAASS